ncbi:MAG: nucleotide exchange factor GrpE [Acidobacteria bacterium]|nr:nucleotide exchange factor GrpE [Acidobacteriota bacterium]
MAWFKKEKMNEQEYNNDEMTDEMAEEFKVNDKRRFSESGERIDVDVKDGSAAQMAEDENMPIETKSPEVVKLENALREISVRCEAAESKLQDVQKRFEEEKANLELETAERRERMKKSLEQKADQGRFNFLTTLLPVLDNLNLAINASETDASFENLLVGVKGTARSFEQALLNVGVETVASIGQTFDPELHEAVDLVETSEENDGKVMAEYARGFTYHGRLLRPARVQVGKSTQ